MKESVEKLVAPKLRNKLNQTFFGKIKLYLLAEEKREFERAVVSLLKYDKEARLLDLGSGDGRLTMKVARKVGTEKIHGIDLNGTSAGILKYHSDLNDDFPVRDELFDIVVASQIIEHLGETDNFLKEMHRVLKPAGYAIISTPNLASFHNILYLLFGRQPEPCSVSDEMDWVEGPAHRRLFTIRGLVKLLRYHGFKVEKVVSSGYHPFPGWLARIVCLIDRWHSTSITVKVRR